MTVIDLSPNSPRVPWHERRATHRHFRWYRNLRDLHELTLGWISETETQRSPHEMERGLPKEVTDSLWLLDTFPETDLDRLMDDTQPDDVLGRLTRTVWAFQASTLASLQERTTSPQERRILDSVLEQGAWKLGRHVAETRWGGLTAAERANLKSLIGTLRDTPFGTLPEGDALLVKRATANEARVQFLACAHRFPMPEVHGVADDLCRIHLHWMQGFAYGLNPAISVTNEKCSQSWVLRQRA